MGAGIPSGAQDLVLATSEEAGSVGYWVVRSLGFSASQKKAPHFCGALRLPPWWFILQP